MVAVAVPEVELEIVTMPDWFWGGGQHGGP